MLTWENCIADTRAGRKSRAKSNRSQFQVDYDRLIFSSPFRRLQNKTQVFPLPGSIFVHNRLTHSLEVASVGRSLGSMAGQVLADLYASDFDSTTQDFYKYDLANVISAACLAHDIGNPAFGHSGEEAISTYFKDHVGEVIEKEPLQNYFQQNEWFDLIHFEGNANSLHILTQNLKGRLPGGFWMTDTTLASIAKYPCESAARNKKFLHRKKFGFFQSEKSIFEEIAASTNLLVDQKNPLAYHRHPFVFLVEAADDICYRIMDLEDAHRLKILSTDETSALLFELIAHRPSNDMNKIKDRFQRIGDVNERIGYLRALSINFLTSVCVEIFKEQEQAMIHGTLKQSLLDSTHTSLQETLNKIDQISFSRIYKHHTVVELEIAGFHILTGLLDLFVPALIKQDKSSKDKNLISLIPDQFLLHAESDSAYQRTLCAIDYVSGMTDIYAVELYKKIKGISIGLS